LWFTNGEQASGSKGSTESRFVAREAALQADRNRKHYQENAALYQGAIRRLAEQIRNCLLVRSESAGIPGRQGVLDPQRVWRYTALQDDHVFFRREEEPVPALSVELLLDASASRLNSQELIAAQGYIIAESLRQCGISVQVDSFCSIRRYTVLRTLKGWGRTEDSRGVFRYFAAGWNRDSLALAAAGGLLGQTNAEKRLLLVLTDAHPSDSCGLQGSGPLSLTRDYDGACAVEDTAKAVHALRREGMRVAAVFMGSTDCAENAVQIYGRQEVARIRSMDQLSDAAGKLICREILA
jgi:nitric oxide reductase activation protein